MMVSFYLRSCYQLTQPPSWKTNPCLSSTAYTINSQLRGGAVDSGTALQVGRSRVRFPMVSLEFFIDIILPAALWPLTEMSTRNISWGVNAAGSYGWQPYHLHVSIVLKSGSLNLLESSGPVQACNGIALPLPYPPSANLRTRPAVVTWTHLSSVFAKQRRQVFAVYITFSAGRVKATCTQLVQRSGQQHPHHCLVFSTS